MTRLRWGEAHVSVHSPFINLMNGLNEFHSLNGIHSMGGWAGAWERRSEGATEKGLPSGSTEAARTCACARQGPAHRQILGPRRSRPRSFRGRIRPATQASPKRLGEVGRAIGPRAGRGR